VSRWFVHHREGTDNRVSGDSTFVASTQGIVAVSALLTLGLVIRRLGVWAYLIASALVVEIAVFLTTNYTVRRPRPPIEHLGSTPSTFSFPSGHVAATVVLYGGIAVLARQRRVHPVWQVTAWVVAVILTVAVAWSRVYRGQHHATDVIAGIFMGAGALACAFVALQREERREKQGAVR
jgi:membrane-associated phospholipid phosphatase